MLQTRVETTAYDNIFDNVDFNCGFMNCGVEFKFIVKFIVEFRS